MDVSPGSLGLYTGVGDSILTPGQPVLVLTQQCQAPDGTAARVSYFRLLLRLDRVNRERSPISHSQDIRFTTQAAKAAWDYVQALVCHCLPETALSRLWQRGSSSARVSGSVPEIHSALLLMMA